MLYMSMGMLDVTVASPSLFDLPGVQLAASTGMSGSFTFFQAVLTLFIAFADLFICFNAQGVHLPR